MCGGGSSRAASKHMQAYPSPHCWHTKYNMPIARWCRACKSVSCIHCCDGGKRCQVHQKQGRCLAHSARQSHR